MTREEVELRYTPQQLGGEVGARQRKEFKEMLDEIYDDSESKTCMNCKYSVKGNQMLCNHMENEQFLDYGMVRMQIHETFSCNKWEQKC